MTDRIEERSAAVATDIGVFTYDNILRMAQRRRFAFKTALTSMRR
jgi:hypothetical protein